MHHKDELFCSITYYLTASYHQRGCLKAPPHPFPALIPFSLVPQKSHVINLKNVKQMLS